MTERWPQAVVFDLDGTLVDSAGDITDALNAAFERAGVAPFTESDVRLMVGGGTRVLIERAVAARGMSADPALARRLHASFLDVYRAAPVVRTTVYEHGRELIAELCRRDVKLAICTNKPQDITEDVLAKLGLRTSFAAVVGGTEAVPKKPDPAMLLAALSALGAGSSRAVMVGDSGADVGAARAAGMPVIAVSFGYSRVPARDLGADLVIDSLADAWSAVRQLTMSAH